MTAELGLGLIGCGAFGAYVLDAVAGLPGLRVTAVADADPARADALARRHRATPCPDPDALLRRPDVDIVAVATPPATHAELSIAALRAGRHVFCEKPLATTAQDAERVGEEASRAVGTLVVDHVLRYNPLLRAVQQLISEGLLDSPRRFLFENDAADEDLDVDHWFWDPERSGGIFVEHGVHFFDVARALLGSEPQEVRATAVRRPGGPVDMVVADVVHPGGVLATHLHSFTHAHRCERQLMRLDHGFAESRITGWIPTHAVITAWTDDAGVQVWEQLPFRSTELLHVPGFRPHPDDRVSVTVHRDVGGAAPARGRGVSRAVPHRVDVVVDLGGEERKPYVYAESVRAAMADLVRCAETGGTPVADARAGVSAVAVAEAATTATVSGRTQRVVTGGERSRTA
ncbi:Gfo/Idh/MocA family oxidoreductase [Streptomyces sp. NPDC006333]|uniref:Gfo/Idh/MocA family protein n=1 Tax=Streptomyces sp. NPDC006333 TaxID=3156753 RepID=UPI00339DB9E4